MKAKNKTNTSRSLADDSRRLIETAAKQPGVAELFKVYEAWRKFEQASEAHNRLIATKQIVSTSSSSCPVLHPAV